MLMTQVAAERGQLNVRNYRCGSQKPGSSLSIQLRDFPLLGNINKHLCNCLIKLTFKNDVHTPMGHQKLTQEDWQGKIWQPDLLLNF